jgi:glycosyltransferase involved in cell wall biosynthesis
MLLWKLNSIDLAMASVRYRCFLPVQYLNLLGYRSFICSTKQEIDLIPQPDAIIFVKSFKSSDLQLAREAYNRNIPIIIDLCDNIFVDNYPSQAQIHPREIFKQMAATAEAIVTTGQALKKAIQAEIGERYSTRIFIVRDGVETLETIQYSENYVRQKFLNGCDLSLNPEPQNSNSKIINFGSIKEKIQQIKKIKDVFKINLNNNDSIRFLNKLNIDNLRSRKLNARISTRRENATNARIKQIIWFGNHGNQPNLGMMGIVEISECLTELAKEIDFQLLVVSNNYEKYCQYILPLSLKTTYVQWTPTNIYDLIAESDVTIVPISTDAFNICKSANRSILSLSLGIPVVATKTPALEPFKDCVLFEEWTQNLKTYLTNSELVQSHIKKAKQIIERDYSGEAIASSWSKIIDRVVQKKVV